MIGLDLGLWLQFQHFLCYITLPFSKFLQYSPAFEKRHSLCWGESMNGAGCIVWCINNERLSNE